MNHRFETRSNVFWNIIIRKELILAESMIVNNFSTIRVDIHVDMYIYV